MDPRFFVLEEAENGTYKILDGFIPGESKAMVALGIGANNRCICQLEWLKANQKVVLNYKEFFNLSLSPQIPG